jgi:hypothetical protein
VVVEPRQRPVEYEMKVSSARVEVPRVQRLVSGRSRATDESEDELRRRVNEIDHHINVSQETGIYGAS